MHRQILRLAIPSIVSNITVPLLGIADTAIAGHLNAASASSIGALSVGVAIFNLLYWTFSFLRMGTTGITAQHFGANNTAFCAETLLRAWGTALLAGGLFLLFRHPLGTLTINLINQSSDPQIQADIYTYFNIRIWAAPATISLYALNGWYIGMQNTRTPMLIAILQNVMNVVCSWFFALRLGMGIAGVALGTVAAQYFSLLLAAGCLLPYRRLFVGIRLRNVLNKAAWLRFATINRDILLRTLCLIVVFTFFTSVSSSNDPSTLAANAILLHFFYFFSYFSDGFAYAAEALVGKFIGEGNPRQLQHCIRQLLWWTTGLAVVFSVLYGVAWRPIAAVFTNSEGLFDQLARYAPWAAIVPLAGTLAFLFDGIMVGSTQGKVLRNAMFVATLAFFAAYYGLHNILSNHALWIAFCLFLLLRGVMQYLFSGRLSQLYEQAEKRERM